MYGPSDLAADNRAFLIDSGLPLPPEAAHSEGERPSAYGMAFTRDKNMLKLICPISYVHKDIPPLMLQHGARDVVVPLQHSALLAEKIERICGPGRVSLVVHDKLGHSEKGFCSADNFLTMLAFFKRHL
jgi:dipeptidyl aminopeptidase/acylaminoacyl peptidase